jgi:hypothetical protein
MNICSCVHLSAAAQAIAQGKGTAEAAAFAEAVAAAGLEKVRTDRSMQSVQHVMSSAALQSSCCKTSHLR